MILGDIRSRIHPPARLAPESTEVLVEFISDYLRWFFTPGEALPEPVRYRFQFPGSIIGARDLIVEDDGARMEPALKPAGESSAGVTFPGATFHCSAETLVLLMCGRLTYDDALANHLLSVTGDHQLATRFTRWFQGA